MSRQSCCALSGASLPPIYRIASRTVGGMDHVTDNPTTFADWFRAVVDSAEVVRATCARHGLSVGQVLDDIVAFDDAEAAALLRADRLEEGRRAPYSEVGRSCLAAYWCRGMEPAQMDLLFGLPEGTAGAWLEHRPPPRNGREIFRRHQVGQTARAIAGTLTMAPTTVRETLAMLGLAPNVTPDRRKAADFRPKVVALAREQIRRRGEPDTRLIIDSLGRQGYEVSSQQVKNAVRAARKKGDLPPARRSPHGRL